jgi:hypothetical protein
MSLLPIVNDDRGSLTPVSTPEAKRPKSVVKRYVVRQAHLLSFERLLPSDDTILTPLVSFSVCTCSILRSPIYSAPISRSSSCRLGSDPQASLPGTVEALRRLNIRPVSSSNGGGTGSNDIKPTESSRSNVHCRDSVRSASRALRSNSRPPPERSKDVNRRFRHHSCPPERTRVRFGFSQAREYERARGRDEHPNAGPFAIALGDRYVTAPPIAIPTEDELLRKQRNTDRVGMSAFKNMPTAEQKCRLLM